jgi:multidrug resistance efflux pump
MADKESVLSQIQQKGSAIKNAPGALRQSAGGSVDKALSPFAQKKQELDAALQKARAPFEAMKAQQQQAKLSMDAAKQQADAAKKVLEGKELLFGTTNDVSDKTMNDAQSTLAKAKQGMEDRQKEYQNAGTMVKDLIVKIEAQAKSAAGDAGTAPGGK